MGKHEYTTLDRARDELFSHIQRCEVLDADQDDHVSEWLEETMDFMAERYPDLSDLQLAQLRMMGQRYLEPVIPHGREASAVDGQDEAEGEEAEVAAGEEDTPKAVAEVAEAGMQEEEAAEEDATEEAEVEATESAEPPEAVTSAV